MIPDETPEQRIERDRMAQQLAHDTVFPPEKRPPPTPYVPPTPEERAAYDARIREAYYIPGVGAFDWYTDGAMMNPGAFTVPAEHPIPFHIGDGELATQQMCANCRCIVFHLGTVAMMTVLRCANCGREWCEHEG